MINANGIISISGVPESVAADFGKRIAAPTHPIKAATAAKCMARARRFSFRPKKARAKSNTPKKAGMSAVGLWLSEAKYPIAPSSIKTKAVANVGLIIRGRCIMFFWFLRQKP